MISKTLARVAFGLSGLGLWAATPAEAWDFTPGLPCILSHSSNGSQVELTYDPRVPVYTISVTRTAPWPDAPVFSMRFSGTAALEIFTDRHVLSNDARRVTVTDRGFGNVLDGLQFNDTAVANIGTVTVEIPLAGAAEPVAAFRLCRPVAGA